MPLSLGKKTGPAAALGLVVLVVVGGVLWRQSATRARVDAPSVSAGTTQPEATAVTGPQPGASSPRAAPRRRLSAEARRTFLAERASKRKAMSERVAGANTALAARHRAEQVDPQWAAGMETRLQEVSKMPGFKEPGVTPTTLDIDCKATTCKIDAGLASRSQGDDWALIYMSSVGSNIKRAYTSVITEPDGTAHVVIYAVAR